MNDFINIKRELSWSLASLWNGAILREQRELTPRDYVWASELGGAYVDRWLKMRAVPPTNPPNMRSLRKFEAGNLVEWVVRFVLLRAGILQQAQTEVWTELPGLLRVKGKLDFMAGGTPDPEKAAESIDSMNLPPSIEKSSKYIVEKLKEKYGNTPLKKIVLEIKSCSVFVMNSLEKKEKPVKIHSLQIFHYLKGLNMDEGQISYICKDDLRMMEFAIWNPSGVNKLYINDLEGMTQAFHSEERPPLEPVVLWDDDLAKFSKNLQVEYSGYLTMLYGFSRPDVYADSIKPKLDRWNRVLGRYAAGDKITDKNKDVRDEILASGYDFENLVEQKKQKGGDTEENEY